MDRILFIMVVFLVLPSDAGAQECDSLKHWYPGEVLMRARKRSDQPGEVRTGCVRSMAIEEMEVAPKLLDSTGHAERIPGRYALSYTYVSGNDTAYYLNTGKEVRTFRWVYALRVVAGEMELYVIRTRGFSILLGQVNYDHYYLRRGGRWLSEKPFVYNEGGKRERLEGIFSGCPAAMERISATKDLDLTDILPDLVRYWNTGACMK